LKNIYKLDKKLRNRDNYNALDFEKLEFDKLNKDQAHLTEFELDLHDKEVEKADKQKINGIDLTTENEKTLYKTEESYEDLGLKFDSENTNRLLNLNIDVGKHPASLTPKEHERLDKLNSFLI